jgi:uncharacterized protein YkwD
MRRFAAALLLLLTLAPSALAGARDTALESNLFQQVNQLRRSHGLPVFKLSTKLAAAAAQHSTQMGADGYFAHESADHSAFWKRVAHWYPSQGWRSWTVGENLLWSSPGLTPSQAVTLWMNSPEHRANLLNPAWREIGLSAVHFDSAPGAYAGMPVTIVTADFGTRR